MCLFSVAFMSIVLRGGKRERGKKMEWKEDFHGSAKLRASVVKPNIRDSIPNTESTMRVCRPRKIKNNCHPLQAPACFYKSIHSRNPLRTFSPHAPPLSHVAQRRRKKERKKEMPGLKTLISGLVNE